MKDLQREGEASAQSPIPAMSSEGTPPPFLEELPIPISTVQGEHNEIFLAH